MTIMGDRLSSHIKALKVKKFHLVFQQDTSCGGASLQTVDWTVPKPGGGVNEYMEILVKETATLHKVLSRYLSPSVVEVRRFPFFASFRLVGYLTDRFAFLIFLCTQL